MKYQVQVTREAMVAFDVEVEAKDEEHAKALSELEALECNPNDWHMLEHGWRMKDFHETYVENKYIYDDNPTTFEACPNCGDEVEIKIDGTSPCTECGHKDMLPCSQCKLHTKGKCDWEEGIRCTPFPLS